MFRVSDGVAGRIRLAMPQATEWQRIGYEIDAAMILAAGLRKACISLLGIGLYS
jgi:hypothetical protein